MMCPDCGNPMRTPGTRQDPKAPECPCCGYRGYIKLEARGERMAIRRARTFGVLAHPNRPDDRGAPLKGRVRD